MENKKSQNQDIINENKGRGLFYGVIAIATFIIMAVGATFAYFTATTSSMDAAVRTGSTTLQLQYVSYGAAWMQDDLIPANDVIVEYSFENQNDTTVSLVDTTNNTLCKDDYGNSICSVYVFQVVNTANSPQTVSLNVVSEENSFASLNAMAYEVAIPEDRTDYDSIENSNGSGDPIFKKNGEDLTENAIEVVDAKNAVLDESQYNEVYINRKGVIKTLLQWVESSDASEGTKVVKPAINRPLVPITEDNQLAEAKDRTVRIADNIEIPGGETKTFALVLYILNDENKDQTSTDAEKTFAGKMVITSGDGDTGVSGQISALTNTPGAEDNLQSKTQS